MGSHGEAGPGWVGEGAPELLHVKFASKEQTLSFATVLTGKSC